MKSSIIRLLHLLSVIFWAGAVQTSAQPLFPEPEGGWDYFFDGDQAEPGNGVDFDALDGTWSHNNESDEWDGSALGGQLGQMIGDQGVVESSNAPGGVQVVEQPGVTYLQLQDTGDPREYPNPAANDETFYLDPSNRKIYFAHDLAEDGAPADVLDTGLTLTFSASVPFPTGMDPLYRTAEYNPANPDESDPSAYPSNGDGTIIDNSGRGNFVVHQANGGSIAFALTVSTDSLFGNQPPFADVSGLTMNALNGNQISSQVGLGQGTQDNGIPLNPLRLHEFYVVIQKDPANVGTHVVYVFRDGLLDPTVFRVTAGDGSDYPGISYLAMGLPSTTQNGALNVNFIGYKIGAVFPPGTVENLPPEILNLTPAEGAIFHPVSDGLSFTATTLGENTISEDGIQLILNGADVSDQLVIGGNEQNREVQFDALVANQFYTGVIRVSDQADRMSEVNLSFDTFEESQAAARVIEAEDYNYGDGVCDFVRFLFSMPSTFGGKFQEGPPPGDPNDVSNFPPQEDGYAHLTGFPGADFNDTTASPPPFDELEKHLYRGCDGVGTQVSGDFLRPKYVQAGVDDYAVSDIANEEWMNYTRTFVDGTYQVYLRASAATEQLLRLDLVSGDTSQPGQTTEPLGFFKIPPSASGYQYVLLSEEDGVTPIFAQLSGEQTVRLTAVEVDESLKCNFLLFSALEAQGAPPTITLTSPEEGSEFAIKDNLSLAAQASSDAGVARVEFFVREAGGGAATKIKELLSAPYSFNWTIPESRLGQQELFARAWDSNGLFSNSEAVTITVRSRPVVTILAPESNTEFAKGDPIPIEVSAFNPEAAITSVQLFAKPLGGAANQIAELTEPPYTFEWSSDQDNLYTLTATAIDINGNEGLSPPVDIIVGDVVIADELMIEYSDGIVILRWAGDFQLQSAPTVLGEWQTIPEATSGYSIEPSGTQFFRLTGSGN